MDPKTSGKNGFGTATKGVHFCGTIWVDIWPMFTRRGSSRVWAVGRPAFNSFADTILGQRM